MSSDTFVDSQTSSADAGGNTAPESSRGVRQAAAGGIDGAASGLHRGANAIPGSAERVAGLAHATADKLSATAGYLREHDAGAMLEDVKTIVKKNPVPALLGAAAVGFLVAKAFSRD